MKLRLENLNIRQEDGSFCPGSLTVADGRFIAGDDTADAVFDGGGMLAVPGLIDLHTHGRIGADFCDADENAIAAMVADYARHGVTALAPSLASDSFDGWKSSAARIKRLDSPSFIALHLEGRYISPVRRGAHDPAYLVAPDFAEVETMAKIVGMPMRVTYAPELDTDGSFRRACVKAGYHLSISHTDADYQTAMAAIRDGVNSFSHLYNTMPALHHRAGGPIAAALTTDVYAELICDGVHVSHEMIDLAYRAKGLDRILLVTDSMAGTGCPDGDYRVGGLDVVVKDGKALTRDGHLAGSTLNLLRGVQNFAAFCRIPFGKALTAATKNPAEYMGYGGKLGTLAPGARADLLLLANESAALPARVMQNGVWLV